MRIELIAVNSAKRSKGVEKAKSQAVEIEDNLSLGAIYRKVEMLARYAIKHECSSAKILLTQNSKTYEWSLLKLTNEIYMIFCEASQKCDVIYHDKIKPEQKVSKERMAQMEHKPNAPQAYFWRQEQSQVVQNKEDIVE
jgi:hypothetical protein